MRMNLIRKNLWCETEEHTSARAASNERRRHKKIKTASNTRLKRNARITIQLETSSTEKMSEEVHRDPHQNGTRALRSLSSVSTDLDKKWENIFFFCSFMFMFTLNFKTLVTYISIIFNFQTTTPLMYSNDYVLYFSSPFKSAFRLLYACSMLSFEIH